MTIITTDDRDRLLELISDTLGERYERPEDVATHDTRAEHMSSVCISGASGESLDIDAILADNDSFRASI